jgi:hypothetical protein
VRFSRTTTDRRALEITAGGVHGGADTVAASLVVAKISSADSCSPRGAREVEAEVLECAAKASVAPPTDCRAPWSAAA